MRVAQQCTGTPGTLAVGYDKLSVRSMDAVGETMVELLRR